MSAGIYLHIPFCKSRCSYCDFATDVYCSSDAVERYVAALCLEIENFAEDSPQADTIYFGGGTPSLLSPNQVEKILNAVQGKFPLASDVELTMEMNPATVTPETLAGYRSLGVNRASFGLQTFDDTELKRLARGHNTADALETFRMLREAGFENVSFDLIAGLPRQTLADWRRNLDRAIDLEPEHLSLYLLEIHEGTPLAEQIRTERSPMPDEELAAEMYEMMIDKLSAAGYEQYEISNFAKTGYESRHNSKYWTLDPVFGFGVSAHSFDGSQRYGSERDTAAYVKQIEVSGTAESSRESIDIESEFTFLGLRLTGGICLDEYRRLFRTDLTEKYQEELAGLSEAGLIEIGEKTLRLTRKGMLYSNEVFRVFI